MPSNEALERENAALRERLARLSKADERIAGELDLDTVLRDALETARALTGAACSGITLLDEAGGVQEFFAPQLSEREYQSLIEMPAGMEFFGHLHGLITPLRVDDLHAYADALGLGPFPLALRGYLCLPIHYRGRHVGSMHLAGKRGAAGFSAEDEEELGLFAQQAAIAIDNARRMRDELRTRTDFLAMLSRELRTPLSSIRGSAAALLKSGPALDAAATIRFQRIIEEQAERMEDMLTDLLDLARIESRELAVMPEPVSLEVLVDAARRSFHSGGARQEIEIELPARLARVMADGRRIVQVLLNLLTNAARHSPGAPTIRLLAVQQDVVVRVTVAYDGVGIEPERLATLFVSNAGGRCGSPLLAGASLGLAIARGIVEAHGGRIWAESAGLGEGAQFHFTLPAVGPAARPPDPSTIRPARGRFRILAVEDDPQTLRYVREALEEAGCEPLTTGDPEAVPLLIALHRPHLVLLGLILRGTNGMELMERLPELRDLPVIFLSAYGGGERIARVLELGADDYIVKPFSPTELVARVRTVLRRTVSETASGPEPSGTYRKGELVIDYAERQVSLGGRPLHLTRLEYRLLYELSRQPGQVVTHAELLLRVWGPAHSGRTGAVRTLVKQLRRKLGDRAERPTYILNEPRIGYHMARPDAPNSEA